MENMHTDVMLLRVRLVIVSFILSTLLFDLGVKHKEEIWGQGLLGGKSKKKKKKKRSREVNGSKFMHFVQSWNRNTLGSFSTVI